MRRYWSDGSPGSIRGNPAKNSDAAIDVFGEVGYAAAGWGAIVERTGMTKGALYHHFDAKEPLASAIIEEGSETLLVAFRSVCEVPAFENMIHGTFASPAS